MHKGKENLIKLALLLTVVAGLYTIVAWASYSPLDNAWSVASSATQSVLNRTGGLGAWIADLLFSMFGKVAFIVPFGLTFTAVYLLILRLTARLDWRQIGLWLGSFVLLMLGLSGIASVVLSNSPYYLSGGFIGGLLNQFIGDLLGQFGVLFIAMILTSVGFYFCSGQIIWQLFNSLYQWIMGDKDDKTAEQAVENPQNSAKTDPLVQPAFMNDMSENDNDIKADEETLESVDKQETVKASGFTDLANFTRSTPNITGIKPKEKMAENVPSLPTDLTDISRFAVEQPVLPKVNVPGTAVTNKAIFQPEAEIEIQEEPFVAFEQPAMPTIRLNPTTEVPVEIQPVQAVENDVSFANPVVEEVQVFENELTENERIELPEPPKPQFMQEPRVKVEPVAAAVVEPTQQEAKTTAYPKGYGESLIHPLLQKKTKVEKPTTPLPTLDLLEQNRSETPQITEQEIIETSARIEQELSNFGVKATVEDVLVGPVVTRYEIKPAAGVKASKITNLDSDLARALIFKAIRITDVVPGKPYMGIETPNKHRETVWLRDVLASDAFRHSKATLPMALGKDISGEPVVVDMAKMPHLLVAGQTGGGKSVGVNTMILSLLFKLSPEQVRFIMIDPKVVELSIYNDIPHLLTPVVTDMKKAENALRWAVEEMERRYLLVSSLSVRNIEGYNDKIRQAEEMGIPIPNTLWRPGDTMDALPPPLEKLSYIVLIVDEFADLMMSAGKQVEDHIMRIAQKARAVGIHLILATQRPSTDVITGVIKANIPSRIAFTVASQIDSRTILDKGGAESLLGRGDMLYSGAGSPEIIRVHGAFMSDDDVQRVADNWRARGKPDYIDSIVASRDEDDESGSSERGLGGELDPLFDEIAQFMIDGGTTSISGIQRRFGLGFNRAARIVDQLEEQGILSAADSRGKREVLAR